MKWQVKLHGDNYDLEELSKSFTSEKLKIYKEGESCFFTSSAFNEITDADIVREKSEDIIGVINGGSKVIKQLKKPIKVDSIESLDNGKRNIYLYLSDTVAVTEVSRLTVIIDGKEQEPHIFEQLPNWVSLATQDNNVAKVLNYLKIGSEDIRDLYNIYEIVKNDVGGEEVIQKNGWSTLNTIRSFKHTANSPDAIGDKARHGVQKSQPPQNPMSSNESKSFILQLVRRWLNSKITH